jgi:hypothetical protein
MFHKHKISDGYICDECFKAAGYTVGWVCFADFSEDLKARIEQRKRAAANPEPKTQVAVSYTEPSAVSGFASTDLRPHINKIEMPDLAFTTIFDFSAITTISYATADVYTSYVLEGENKTRAIESILSLNPRFGRTKIHAEKLRFVPTNGDYTNTDYTRAFLTPLTKTGKIAKYPVVLMFTTMSNDEQSRRVNGFHGEISYLQNGAIGKYRVHQTTWHSNDVEITTYKDNFTT